jgi:aminoglycoside phosphotransferase (APT) family kinase protein
MTRPAWHQPLDARARTWAASAVGSGWGVRRVRRIAGGVATAVDALVVAGPGGEHRELVMRRWLRPGWELEDPDLTPAHEAAVLARLGTTGLPVPTLVAVDPDGAACGAPALLALRLPGSRPSPSEQREPARLRRLGEAMAAIHGVDAGLHELVPPFRPYYPADAARTPANTPRPELWARALDVVATPPPDNGGAFLHRDFHPGNTLWTWARLTGIVDWTAASWGPIGADLGHLRANLGPDHGIAAADGALAAYEAATGTRLPDQPWWDVRMLLDLLDEPDALPAAQLDAIETYLEAVVARATTGRLVSG